jgi:hypothetical protein
LGISRYSSCFTILYLANLGRLQVAKLIQWEGRTLTISAWREEG